MGKPAWESTPLENYPASLALDGDMSTFSHTISGDPHPWWKVDLLSEHCLGSITVSLRDGCCYQDRFITAVARAGLSFNIIENQPCGAPATRAQSAPGSVNTFLCDTPRMARYVSLDIDASNPATTDPMFMLAEVTVQEFTAGECPVPTDPIPVPVHVNATSANFELMYKGAAIGNTGPLATRVAKSAKRCAASCLKLTGCVSFDYAPGTGQCHLHNLNAQDIHKIPNEDFMIFVPVQ
ncbi:uncharacterized protein LOC119735191 [Patiria miniata]|uniref:Fucolectin tachylectin-4 pentraxin-1 domain-containing protein n=1 Tax=Patiria miniata TaxID=46514 RepID=A0A914AN22_PATMI|nr:uncharacterized protein LOC119735191 [Patiria miniata]